MLTDIVKLADVVINGRPAEEPKAGVNWPELIRRKKSVVRVGNKHYAVTVEPVTLQAKVKA